jgi:esterase
MKLFARISGTGRPMIILHGLFGSSDNWYSLAKVFAQNYTVFAVDQRNHGQSPHSDEFDYKLLTDDLLELFQDHKLDPAVIIGHSMGGKTAMNFAVKYPERTDKLIVVDIAPREYSMRHEHIVAGLKAIPLETVTSRNEAETVLKNFVSDAGERQFLLKNLERNPAGGFHWKINLKSLDEHMDQIGRSLEYSGVFNKPALFIRGAKSNYVVDRDEPEIRKIFPEAEFKVLDTGHWVQAEKPQEFVETVLSFLNQ